MVELGLSNQLLAGLLLAESITERNQIELNIFSISTFEVSSPKKRAPTKKYRKTRKLCSGFNRALRAVKKNRSIFVRTILDKMRIIIH